MKPRHLTNPRILAICFAMLPLAAANAQTTGTWNNNTTTGLSWNTVGSWTGLTNGQVPNAIGATANFTMNITAARTITMDGDKTVGTLAIDDPTPTSTTYHGYTINAGTTFPTSRLIFDVASGNAALNSPTAGNNVTNNIGVPITINDPLVITSTKTNVNGTLNLNGSITDEAASLSITKEGNGIVQLAAANTYDGGTFINAGRLGAGNATSYGTGSVTVASGGQAWLSSGATYGNDFTLAGQGYANTADAGALNGAMRYGGATTSGTIHIAADARIGGYGGANGTMAGPLTGSAALEINQSGASHNGNIVLTGNAAGYTGTITVSQGTLRLGPASNLGGSLVVKDGANLYAEGVGGSGAATIGTDSGSAR
ncbi:MAG: autotransporter-associated beta strand repeat-containing protein, partial [Akkermansiaceae bacterium]|nr:autotransporter-associated beta strand repeat-containing protein [Akkermansiaceae bacterium]